MSDHKAAALNFLNALERIPKLIEQYRTQNVTMERDIPTLQEVVNGTWRKEEDLRKLKSALSELERRIQLTLAPQKGEQSNKEQKPSVTETIPEKYVDSSQPVRIRI